MAFSCLPVSRVGSDESLVETIVRKRGGPIAVSAIAG